jgi:hypothetical protein
MEAPTIAVVIDLQVVTIPRIAVEHEAVGDPLLTTVFDGEDASTAGIGTGARLDLREFPPS